MTSCHGSLTALILEEQLHASENRHRLSPSLSHMCTHRKMTEVKRAYASGLVANGCVLLVHFPHLRQSPASPLFRIFIPLGGFFTLSSPGIRLPEKNIVASGTPVLLLLLLRDVWPRFFFLFFSFSFLSFFFFSSLPLLSAFFPPIPTTSCLVLPPGASTRQAGRQAGRQCVTVS